MHKYYILYIIGLLYLCSCNNTPKEVRFTEQQIASLHLGDTKILVPEEKMATHLDLTPFLGKKEFDLGSMVEKVKLVALETTEESLVDGILKIIITDNYIYIFDRFKRGGIIIFTAEGKFVKRFSHGQGPGELQRLYDIDYNFDTKELIAFQHSFFLFFDKEGNYLRQERLPINFYNFIAVDNGYIFKAIPKQGNTHLNEKKNYAFLFTKTDFSLESVAISQTKDIKALSAYYYIYKNDSLISLTGHFSDSIYKYDAKKDKLYTKFVLDYDKKLPKKYIYGDDYSVFERYSQNNDCYFNIGDYLETFSQNVFFLQNYYNGYRNIIFRDKRTGNMIGGAITSFNRSEIPFFGFPIAVAGDNFVSLYTPDANDYAVLKNSKYISEADKEKIKQFKDDDNPILLYFTLKEF